jgi:hypothetical protein
MYQKLIGLQCRAFISHQHPSSTAMPYRVESLTHADNFFRTRIGLSEELVSVASIQQQAMRYFHSFLVCSLLSADYQNLTTSRIGLVQNRHELRFVDERFLIR